MTSAVALPLLPLASPTEANRAELFHFAQEHGAFLAFQDGNPEPVVTVLRDRAADLQQTAHQVPDSGYLRGYLDALRLVLRGFLDGMERQHQAEKVADTIDSARYRILRLLAVTPRRRAQLPELTGLSDSHISRVLAALSNEGLVGKTKAPLGLDARAVLWRATVAGEELVAQTARFGLHPDVDADAASDEALNRANQLAARSMLADARSARRKLWEGEKLPDSEESPPEAVRKAHLTRLRRVLDSDVAEFDKWLALEVTGELLTATRLSGGTLEDQETLERRLEERSGQSPIGHFAAGLLAFHLGKRSQGDAHGTHTTALDYFDDAEAHFRVVEGHRIAGVLAAEAWNRLAAGDAHRRAGNIAGALKWTQRAFESAKEAEEPYAVLKSGITLGLLHRTAGEPDRCIHLLGGIRNLAIEHGYTTLAAQCDFHVGEASRYKGALGEAGVLLRAAVEVLADRDPKTHAFALSALGAWAFDTAASEEGVSRQRDLRQCRDTLRQALDAAERTVLPDAQALCLRRLGLVEAVLGNQSDAKVAVGEALELYSSQRVMSRIGQVECHATLARMTADPTEVRAASGALGDLARGSVWLVGPRGPKSDAFALSGHSLRLVDRWVYENLKGAVSITHDDEQLQMVRTKLPEAWKSLYTVGLAGGLQVQAGRSPMGKEPLVLTA
ncbi:ArsR family transcriptional regulator [Solicola sp. PLA-1-18]|uniref:ArsR family transcriptional regulator n=1 Tax=Solicola sp. PLA-1-18 TaxID=3380532 RepID=UPI003B782691